MRRAASGPTYGTKTFPAPVRGWIEDENLALNRGLGCSVLENCFPQQNTIRVRKGMGFPVAWVGAAAKSLVPYQAGITEKLFASTDTALYDISAFVDDTVPSRSWTLTEGVLSYVQMDTGGGQFLVVANGVEPWLYFNGTAWFPIVDTDVATLLYDAKSQNFVVGATLTGGSSSATGVIVGDVLTTSTTGTLYLSDVAGGPFTNNETITGSSSGGSALANGGSDDDASQVVVTGVDTRDLKNLWVHSSRVWGVESGTMNAWYLPPDSLGGEAEKVALGGVFQRGGTLMFGGTWSSDSGSGFNDRVVFVTTLGEIAVFQSDPALDDWGIVGRYDVGSPLSPQTWKAGGDLIIATTDGLVPMSAIVSKDPAILETAAVSYNIKPAWTRVARSNSNELPVQLVKWQKGSMGLVGYPHRTETHVVNLATGAWAKWTGLDFQCGAVYQDQAFYGDSSGYIFNIESGGSDNGAIYLARGSLLPDPLGAPGALKAARQARATFRALRPFEVKLSAATDYGTSFPTPPSSIAEDDTPAIWDVGTWDVSRWDDSDTSEVRETRQTRWRSIGRSGFVVAPQWQIACGALRQPDAELVMIDVTYSTGGVVV